MVLGRDICVGDAERDSKSLPLEPTPFIPCKSDLLVCSSRLTPTKQYSFVEPQMALNGRAGLKTRFQVGSIWEKYRGLGS